MIKIYKYLTLKKLLPCVLTALVIIGDQASKNYIASNWPITEDSGGIFIKDVFGNGFLEIVHVRNKAIAFSLGSGIPDNIKSIIFVIVPILALLFLIAYYFRSNDWTRLQRWALAGIFGGGAGNIIDRVYPRGAVKGVVDFISIKFYGIFGLERWPTFNVADATVVICVILILISFFLPAGKLNKK